MQEELKIGDLVILKSCKLYDPKHPVMTINDITPNKRATCVWHNKTNGSVDVGKFNSYVFSMDAIELWNDTRK